MASGMNAGLRPTCPRISVIMPVFNGTQILDRAIDSLCRQTFSHWELLAVDDASTDDSHDQLLRWSGRDPRIKVLRADANKEAVRGKAIHHSYQPSIVNASQACQPFFWRAGASTRSLNGSPIPKRDRYRSRPR
jgi:hypothetical protein